MNVNSYLTLLACISPIKGNLSGTLSTLRFAQNAKQLKNEPRINAILQSLKVSSNQVAFKCLAYYAKNSLC